MNFDPKTIAYLKRARNKPAAWSFELNTYGPSGRHTVVLSEDNRTAIADALRHAQEWGKRKRMTRL